MPTEATKFRALDPGLSFLATKAAIELDRLIRRKGGGLDSVHELAELLSEAFGLGDPAQRSALVDPANAQVFRHAYHESHAQRLESLEDLLLEATALSKKLTEPSASDDENLETMRDFCLALSRAASAYREAVFGPRPAHHHF